MAERPSSSQRTADADRRSRRRSGQARSQWPLGGPAEDDRHKARGPIRRHGRRHPRARRNPRHFRLSPSPQASRTSAGTRTSRNRLERLADGPPALQGHNRDPRRLPGACPSLRPARLVACRISLSQPWHFSPHLLISRSPAFRQHSPLFQKLAALILGSSLSEWLTVLAGLGLLLGLLADLEALLDLGGTCPRRGRDRAWPASRSTFAPSPNAWAVRARRNARPIAAPQGLDEDFRAAVRLLVRRSHWEELYRSPFRLRSASCEARDRWARRRQAPGTSRYAAWRDPIFRWIDARLGCASRGA